MIRSFGHPGYNIFKCLTDELILRGGGGVLTIVYKVTRCHDEGEGV